MTKAKDIIVLCAGGHARVVIDIMRRSGQSVAALADNNPALHGKAIDDVPIVDDDEGVLRRDPKSVLLINALGNAPRIGDSGLGPRRELFERFKSKGYMFMQVRSLNAVISKGATLGEGSHIITSAIVHPGCTIGANSIINTGAQIDHGCRVGDHSHIAPGAILGGEVDIGKSCHVGAGAIIEQGTSIGDGAVVGAGAVVVKDIPPSATALGNPARPKIM